MAGVRKGPTHILVFILALLQIGLGVAIAVIVRQELWYYTTWRWRWSFWGHTTSENVCYMSAWGQPNICIYAYVVVGIGWLASFFLIASQFMWNHDGTSLLPPCISLLSAAWWIAAAVVATVYGTDAVEAKVVVPKHSYRTAVWAMAWASVGLWLIALLSTLAACTRSRRRPATQPDFVHSPAFAPPPYYHYPQQQPAPMAAQFQQQVYPGPYTTPPPTYTWTQSLP